MQALRFLKRRRDTVTLWRPCGQAEVDLVNASQGRSWPPPLPGQAFFTATLSRSYATKMARECHVPAGGVGIVNRFDVRRRFLDRYSLHQVGGPDVLEYRIPAKDVGKLNENIVSWIGWETEYRAAVPDDEFILAAEVLGRPLPAPWRAYLQGQSWFAGGWLPNGCYVTLNNPARMLELHEAWDTSMALHPGIAIIGSDGSRGCLVLDLRVEPAPVLMVQITSEGWDDAVRQADDVGTFIERIESGTFEFA